MRRNNYNLVPKKLTNFLKIKKKIEELHPILLSNKNYTSVKEKKIYLKNKKSKSKIR